MYKKGDLLACRDEGYAVFVWDAVRKLIFADFSATYREPLLVVDIEGTDPATGLVVLAPDGLARLPVRVAQAKTTLVSSLDECQG